MDKKTWPPTRPCSMMGRACIWIGVGSSHVDSSMFRSSTCLMCSSVRTASSSQIISVRRLIATLSNVAFVPLHSPASMSANVPIHGGQSSPYT